MGTPPRWGLVATIKAPTDQILDFAAYHAELGAHRIYIYLDEPDDATIAALKPHPKVRVVACDHAYWLRQPHGRPKMHQPRQIINATHAYQRKPEVDWLVHIDCDEFLWPDGNVSDHLAALAPSTLCARLRPMEVLADGDGQAFKAYSETPEQKTAFFQELYPNFGLYLRRGFLSHAAGKLFVRTGLDNVTFKIHRAFQNDVEITAQTLLTEIPLCHVHAPHWGTWLAHYRYRLTKGAYRPQIRAASKILPNLNIILSEIESQDGEAGLRRFFDEICLDTPAHRAALLKLGLLRICDLKLAEKRARQFPSFAQNRY